MADQGRGSGERGQAGVVPDGEGVTLGNEEAQWLGWGRWQRRAGGREAKGFFQPGRKILSSVSKYKTKMPGTERGGLCPQALTFSIPQHASLMLEEKKPTG